MYKRRFLLDAPSSAPGKFRAEAVVVPGVRGRCVAVSSGILHADLNRE